MAGTTCPDLAMSVHQVAHFCSNPKLSHEWAVMRIVKYLQGTKDKGIVFRPDPSKGLECFVDADFAGDKVMSAFNLKSDYPVVDEERYGEFANFCFQNKVTSTKRHLRINKTSILWTPGMLNPLCNSLIDKCKNLKMLLQNSSLGLILLYTKWL